MTTTTNYDCPKCGQNTVPVVSDEGEKTTVISTNKCNNCGYHPGLKEISEFAHLEDQKPVMPQIV